MRQINFIPEVVTCDELSYVGVRGRQILKYELGLDYRHDATLDLIMKHPKMLIARTRNWGEFPWPRE